MFYTHGALDRADHLRKDADAIAALRARPDARLLPVWRGAVLVSRWSDRSGTAGDSPRPGPGVAAATLPGDAALGPVDASVGEIFLGLVGEAPLFAVSVSARAADAPPAEVAALATGADGAPLDAEFSDLRVVGPVLSADDGALLAYARGLALVGRDDALLLALRARSSRPRTAATCAPARARSVRTPTSRAPTPR